MDLLSELLSDIHIGASSIGHFTLRPPFHLVIDPDDYGSSFSFVVLHGHCGWRTGDGVQHRLGPGDAVLGLRRRPLLLASDFTLGPTSMADAWRANGLPIRGAPRDASAPIRFTWGGRTGIPMAAQPAARAASTELLAIAYSFGEQGLRHPLFQALPDHLLVPAADARQSAAVQGALAFLNSESEVAEPGYAAMAAHFSETLFLGLLRSHALQRDSAALGSLRALRDARLRAALSAVHAEPSRHWTVQALAQTAAMSRSVFAERFASGLGMPPMAYVAALRMHLARRRLETERVPIGLLAEQLGYRSERAFRQAFQRSLGHSPREWRRRFGA